MAAWPAGETTQSMNFWPASQVAADAEQTAFEEVAERPRECSTRAIRRAVLDVLVSELTFAKPVPRCPNAWLDDIGWANVTSAKCIGY